MNFAARMRQILTDRRLSVGAGVPAVLQSKFAAARPVGYNRAIVADAACERVFSSAVMQAIIAGDGNDSRPPHHCGGGVLATRSGS